MIKIQITRPIGVRMADIGAGGREYNVIESPIPGYVHNPAPDRYPTRETWPRPGTRGHYKGKPVQLMEIYFQYYALFKTGPYSVMRANLQDFTPCE